MPLRFNHMEPTLPRGTFARERDQLTRFYKEIFDFDAIDEIKWGQTPFNSN